MRTSMRRWRPWVAAALNFFLWGLGYLWNGRRKLLGFATCCFVLATLYGAQAWSASPSPSTYYTIMGMFAVTWIFLSFAFARDAYLDARRGEEHRAGTHRKRG
jgi:hypothetical protein